MRLLALFFSFFFFVVSSGRTLVLDNLKEFPLLSLPHTSFSSVIDNVSNRLLQVYDNDQAARVSLSVAEDARISVDVTASKPLTIPSLRISLWNSFDFEKATQDLSHATPPEGTNGLCLRNTFIYVHSASTPFSLVESRGRLELIASHPLKLSPPIMLEIRVFPLTPELVDSCLRASTSSSSAIRQKTALPRDHPQALGNNDSANGGAAPNSDAIIGGVVGGVLGLALFIALYIWYRRHQRLRNREALLMLDSNYSESTYIPPHPSDTAGLPPDWMRAYDDHGNVYYYNTAQDISQWEEPTWN
jgi:hypothetical protein